MPDLKEKRVEVILQQLEELPTLPSVAVRVLEVAADDDSSAQEIAHLLGADPTLSARILQLVRRDDAGRENPVSSVESAMTQFGFEAVRSAVLAISVFQTFGPATSAPAVCGQDAPAIASPHAASPVSGPSPFSREEFWKHSLAVACCAELLAERCTALGGMQGRDAHAIAFLCGLLHDVGKIALDTILPKSFSRVVEAADLLRGNIADVERNVIGLDHMVAGKRLAERWELPAGVRDCAWLHGQAPQALPAHFPNAQLVNLVSLADQIVREQHMGYSGNYLFSVPRQDLLTALGIDEAQVADAVSQLTVCMEPRASALGLDEVSSGDLYQQALAQANKELERIGSQLATKNRRLAVRAKFFNALSGFQTDLRPDAPPAHVVQAIGQAAVGVLGTASIAVFSLPPSQAFAETILLDETGRVLSTSLIDLPRSPAPASAPAPDENEVPSTPSANFAVHRPARPATGDGPIMTAGVELEWLLALVSPRLAGDKRFWICLESDAACIGGVVWGATSGEVLRLGPQAQELLALSNGWALALRAAQIREEARTLFEQLASANRQLQTAQNEILRSRTMISVGEMAAGAAHEMNNPLAVISGRSQLLASQLSDPKHKAAAHLIHEQSHRLSAIITEMMDFARPERPEPRVVEAAEIVERALHEAKLHDDPADRTIELTMGDIPVVRLDARQVSAALREVIENAIHATDPSTGHISVHAAHDPYSRRVVVTVTDNGHGMDENTVKRAFDPFFSNKPAGRRRGLGLAKAFRWIEASGGSIRLESRVGQGTRAVVLLPATEVATPLGVAAKRAENF